MGEINYSAQSVTEQPVSEPKQTPDTPLAALRQEFAQEFAKPRLFKRLPAHAGKLVGEFQPLTKKDVREAAVEEGDEWLMASALVSILVDAPDHENADKRGLVPLGVYIGKPEEDPIKFDHRLCDILSLEKQGPEKIALYMCENNDLVAAELVGELGEWSTDTHNEKIQDFKLGSRKTS